MLISSIKGITVTSQTTMPATAPRTPDATPALPLPIRPLDADTWDAAAADIEAITELKREKDAVILAHNYMTGDIFRGYVMNAMFNFVSKATDQSIHLLGILTEAIHTPHLQDRYLAIRNAQHVMNQIASLSSELMFQPDGKIVRRAHEVLDEAVRFLTRVEEAGLLRSIAEGVFADIKRSPDGGKGLEGVIEKGPDYWNPFEQFLHAKLGVA